MFSKINLRTASINAAIFFFANIAFAGVDIPAKITCTISKTDDNTLIFTTIGDIIQEAEEQQTFKINKSERVAQAAFLITEPTTVRITYDTRNFDCYIEPGQHLKLDFEENSFPNKISFEGDGAAHNTYLLKAAHHFQKYNNKIIQSRMFASSSMTFRAFIDQILKEKWAFFRKYNASEKAKFSQAFMYFAAANIDYWRASLLMQYREEHENALLTESSSTIPDEYYTFLDETLINNDDAFNNPYYRKFLKQYGWFRLTHPSFKHGLAARQIIVEVASSSLNLYEAIDLTQPILACPKYTRLILVDKMSYEVEDEKTPIAYRLRVRTTDGIDGWLRPVGIKLIRPNDINQNALYIENFEIKKRKKHIDATIEIDSLSVYTDQNEEGNDYVTKLTKKDRVSVLNAVTGENRSYMDWNSKTLYTAPFQKIRTASGILGWVTMAGLKKEWLVSNIIEQKAEIEAASRSLYENIDYFFYGRAKYFLAALVVSDGFQKGNGLAVKPLYNLIKKENTSEALAKSLNLIIADAEKYEGKQVTKEEETRTRLMRQSVALNIAPPNFRLPYSSSLLASGSISVEEESRVIASERKKKAASKKNINEFKPKNLEKIDYQANKYNLSVATIAQKGKKGIVERGHLYLYNSVLSESPTHIDLQSIKKGMLATKTPFWEAKLSEPTLGIIYADRDSFEVFLEPNDRLEIETITKGKKNHIIATGIGSMHFKYMQSATRYFAKVDKEVMQKKAENLSIADWKAFMDDKLVQKYDFFEKFPKSNQFSLAFKQYCLAEITYWHAYRLLAYVYGLENDPLNKDKEIVLPDNYFDFIPNKEAHGEYAIYSKEYRKFIELYNIIAAKNNREGGRMFSTLPVHKRLISYRKAQYLLGDLSNGFLDNKKVKSLQEFVDENAYPALDEAVMATYYGKLCQEENSLAPDFSLLNANGTFEKLSAYRGKVVYLHFWKNDDPNSETSAKIIRDLRGEYAKRNVVFLSINLDETVEEWKTALKAKKNMGTHLYRQAESFYDAPIEIMYQIHKTPSAILIDERGRIAKVASSLLNDNMMIQKLNELLDK